MYFEVNECNVSDHLKSCNNHYSTEKHHFYNSMSLKSNTYMSHILYWSPQHLVTSQSASQFQSPHCLSWHFQMFECRDTDLQIKQEWIQLKDVHPLYQVQVVSDNVDVGVAPAKPWKWLPLSTLTMTLIYKKPPNFFICSHLETSRRFPSRV